MALTYPEGLRIGSSGCDAFAKHAYRVAAVDEEAALVTFEAFKIWGGEIQAINAFFRILPLETPRFWPSAR